MSVKLWLDLGLKNPSPQIFCFFSFGRFVVWWIFLYGDYVRVKRVCASPLYQLPRRPRKWSLRDCLPPSFALNASAVFVPDKTQPCQTSLFAMLISLSCQHIASVASQNRFFLSPFSSAPLPFIRQLFGNVLTLFFIYLTQQLKN